MTIENSSIYDLITSNLDNLFNNDNCTSEEWVEAINDDEQICAYFQKFHTNKFKFTKNHKFPVK